jgi:predicted negative regulator of RcsB-dependent stress response
LNRHSKNVRFRGYYILLALSYVISSLTMYLGNTGLFFPNYAYATASANVTTSSLESMNISKIPIIQKNQTENQTAKAQNYNSTDTTISSFKSGHKLLIQATNDINAGNIRKALINLNNAKVMIEQQQLAALDLMSNPVFQAARGHLLSAKHYIETGNTDAAVSELFILRQLKILHEQGMMTMKLPMTRDLNSTFYSAETHLLAAGEALNAYDPQRAISELDMASEQLYSHQLAMLDVINSLFSNTRTHLQQAINDIKANNTKEALSHLNKVISSLDEQIQGVLMIKGLPSTVITNRLNVTT